MDEDHFRPRCDPVDVVMPVRVLPRGAQRDDSGRPTRHEARRGRWRQTTSGFYVPADTDSSTPEQRIAEQSMRAGDRGVVTAWAALRLWGAAYFDGRDPDGAPLPVPLISPRQLDDTEASTSQRCVVRPGERWRVQGVRAVSAERALSDELLRLDEIRARVVAVDMTLAARVTSLKRLRAHAARQRGRLVDVLLEALMLAEDRSLSPRESAMRLVWMLDAGLPRPLSNRLVYGLDGTVLGRPDLLDPEVGVAGEYDGAAHRDRDRHRADVRREAALREHGLEVFTIVAGDSTEEQTRRMRTTRDRALHAQRVQLWTLDPPHGAWVPPEPDVDAELDARDARFGWKKV